MKTIGILSTLMIAAVALPAGGQTSTQLMTRGLRAYQELDYQSAATLLRQAVQQLTPSTSNHVRALSYLAATEVYLGSPDSAASRFTTLLVQDPRYRVDQLTFPPEVWVVFETVRRGVRAVAVDIPPQTSLPLAEATLSAKAFVTTRHFVTVDILRSIGSRLTTLYRGPIVDSLEIRWNPRDANGAPLAAGRYILSVTSQDSTRRPERVVQIPLQLQLVGADTLSHPLPPADSAFLPERSPPLKPGLALLRGLAVGGAVFVVPPILMSGSDYSGVRIPVSVAAGIIGFLGRGSPPMGKALPQNVRANESLVAQWEQDVARIADENTRTLANARLIIRAGPAVYTDPNP